MHDWFSSSSNVAPQDWQILHIRLYVVDVSPLSNALCFQLPGTQDTSSLTKITTQFRRHEPRNLFVWHRFSVTTA